MRRVRKGRPRIEERTQTIEAKKPWLKLEMSQRTRAKPPAQSYRLFRPRAP
jgi:hypothetical protein